MKKGIKFETFLEPKGWFGGEPEIGILEKGGFSFSTAFNKKYKLAEMNHIVLHFAEDQDYYYVGFSFSNDDKIPGTMKVYHPKKEYGIVQCISFFKKFSLDCAKYKGRYKVELQESRDGSNMYIISVRK